MSKHHSYFHNGREIDEREAFHRNGCLRDGVSTRVSMQFRDARMTDLQRAVAADAANRRLLVDGFGQPPGHLPGFVFLNDAATREARGRMYALKDVEYENAWRGPNATCPSSQGSGEADDGSECETCHGEGILNPSYEANVEEAYRNTHHESLPRRIDHRSVDQMVRDHRAHMARLYDARDRELSETWRQNHE